MKAFLSLCLISMLLACYNYAPNRSGYVRPANGGWLLPSYPIGVHHLQLTLLSTHPDSTGESTTYGTIECFLSDTLQTGLPVRNLIVTSLRFVVEPGDTVDAALTRYAATLEKREDKTYVGPRADIAPFNLPQSISNIQAILAARLPGASTDGKDSLIEFAEGLHLEKGLALTTWVTWEHYPNPFSPTNTIEYVIPGEDSAFVTLDLYNVLGEKVAVLVNGYQRCGRHEITPNLEARASGVYFSRLTVGTFTATKKLLLLR